MDKLLIVSEKSSEYFSFLKDEIKIGEIAYAKTSKEARELLLKENFDLHIIVSPLLDGSGLELAREISGDIKNQIIFVVKKEYLPEAEKSLAPLGIFAIAKPLSKIILLNIIKCMDINILRLEKIIEENIRLNDKLAEQRLVDRAKCILIEYLKMTENEAHRYIEKQAMDLRIDKRTAARNILKTYESPKYLNS